MHAINIIQNNRTVVFLNLKCLKEISLSKKTLNCIYLLNKIIPENTNKIIMAFQSYSLQYVITSVFSEENYVPKPQIESTSMLTKIIISYMYLLCHNDTIYK